MSVTGDPKIEIGMAGLGATALETFVKGFLLWNLCHFETSPSFLNLFVILPVPDERRAKEENVIQEGKEKEGDKDNEAKAGANGKQGEDTNKKETQQGDPLEFHGENKEKNLLIRSNGSQGK